MRNFFKAIAFCIGICAAFTGCGTGVTMIALVSPSISQVSPQVVTAGTPAVTVTVQGSNFSANSALTVNGAAVPTSFVSATTLAAKISGSPLAQPNVAKLQVKNTDGSQSNQVSLTVTSAPTSPQALSIATPVLPGAQIGVAYSGFFSATGGTPGYTWAVTSGSLPAGMTLTSAGVLSGTPTLSATSTFVLTVTDSSSPAQQKSVTLSIVVSPVTTAPATLVANSVALGAGKVGSAYAVSLSASGGTPGYTWTVSSGSLPAGLALSSAGVISGTPTATGSATFTAQVSDSGSPVQTASVSESVTVTASSLSISASALGAGKTGTSYSATLSAAGGTPGYTWTVTSGSLPAGLSLSSAGVISGTPSTAGSATFTLSVSDSGSPVQTASVQESITVASSTLSIMAGGSLPAGKTSSSYNATVTASGGTPGYTWTVTSGSLPAGLALSTSGVISGTPTVDGTSTFTIGVQDSGSPVQTASAQESITVSTPPLTIASTALIGGTDGTTYSASLAAAGGTPGYTWSAQSSSLPTGLTLSSAGVLSGTPTVSGTFSLAVSVTDNSSPAQTQTGTVSLNIVPAASSTNNTWYVRPDGGTRYSSNVPTGQCDGLGDAAYPGTGVNQHCAYKDVRNLWTDGTYCVDSSATSACWKWVGASGDTYLIRGSLATGVTYRIGQNGPNVPDYYGLAGNPYGAGMPPPISGTAANHTKILGENYGSCSAQSARTQLHGGYGVQYVVNMMGVSYVDLQCIDITDFSSCGRSGQLNKCTTAAPLSDYATNGIAWSNTSTNDTVTNVRVHGISNNGMIGPTGDGVVMTGIDIVGNAGAGWEADPGNQQTGVGSVLVQNFSIQWNGCAEEYPIVDSLPYQDCADDNSGGYGDGFGTATMLAPAPGWQVHFDNGVVAYNTQDGLDALHLIGGGSSMTITRVLAYGNMGQQIKIGGAAGTAINNVIVTNCNALREAIPGTPAGYNARLSDFCRAADTGIELTVGKGAKTVLQFNTIYSASGTGIEVDCDVSAGACDSTSQIDYRNNIFIGYMNNKADGYPGGGTGNYSNPIYVGDMTTAGYPDPFTNPGSVMSNNVTYHWKTTYSCPSTMLGEVSAICSDPNLTDETWHLYGYGDATPLSSTTVVQGAGVTIPGVNVDYTGATRGTPPSIGAYEH